MSQNPARSMANNTIQSCGEFNLMPASPCEMDTHIIKDQLSTH